MNKFIYDGEYSFFITSCAPSSSSDVKIVKSKRFPSYSAPEWLYNLIPGIYFGINVKLKDKNNPYKSNFIEKIRSHPDMRLVYMDVHKDFPEFCEFKRHKDDFPYVKSVKRDLFIGSLEDANNLMHLTDFDTVGDGSVACVGYDEDEEKYAGWSHRAYCSFGTGDKLFIESFCEEDLYEDKSNDDDKHTKHPYDRCCRDIITDKTTIGRVLESAERASIGHINEMFYSYGITFRRVPNENVANGLYRNDALIIESDIERTPLHDSTPFKQHGIVCIETDDDALTAAKNFARYVS